MAHLDLVWAQNKTAISKYEKAIQVAFREVADALDSSKAIGDELNVEQHWRASESRRVQLS